MKNEIEITESHKQMCQEFVALARKMGLKQLSAQFKTNDGWGAKISFGWEQGRHGVENTINISSQFYASSREKVSD